MSTMEIESLNKKIETYTELISEQEEKIASQNEVIEKAMDYCIEYQSLIETRYSTSEYYRKENGIYIKDENGNQVIEKVLAFIYDDIKIDNLMVCDGKVYIKTPINVNIGDPFYDFKYLSLIALENEDFASGILDGYFDGKFSKDFFIMLKYYTSELIITGYNKHLDKDTVDKIIDSYDDYTLEIPKWYKTKK